MFCFWSVSVMGSRPLFCVRLAISTPKLDPSRGPGPCSVTFLPFGVPAFFPLFQLDDLFLLQIDLKTQTDNFGDCLPNCII